MPFLYVYSASDFVSGLPDESGSAAAGTAPFTLTLAPGATPTLIEVTDDEAVFDEVDASQSLTNAVNIDGSAFGAGTTINTAYDLINTTTGHKMTSFHFGGDGYQQGAVDGIVSTVELVEGTNYTFNSERTSHQQNNQYTDYFACFDGSVQIETKRGLVRADTLKVGDKVLTFDHGYQPLRAVLSRKMSAVDLRNAPNMRPVRVSAGALGQGLPRQDVLVSPQHRFLAVSPVAKRMFGHEEALISAKKLTALPGIFVDETVKTVEYFHLVMDQHEIVIAEGAPTESFYCGKMALSALDAELRSELDALFPELRSGGRAPEYARVVPKSAQQAQFIQRHCKNKKPLLIGAGAI